MLCKAQNNVYDKKQDPITSAVLSWSCKDDEVIVRSFVLNAFEISTPIEMLDIKHRHGAHQLSRL